VYAPPSLFAELLAAINDTNRVAHEVSLFDAIIDGIA
jgi:hypothetical protein